MRATRAVVAVAASAAALAMTTAPAHAARPAPEPTATLDCAFTGTGKTVAVVTVRNAAKPVKWQALYIDYASENGETTRYAGTIDHTAKKVLRFRFDSEDQGLELLVKRSKKVLLHERADYIQGCGAIHH